MAAEEIDAQGGDRPDDAPVSASTGHVRLDLTQEENVLAMESPVPPVVPRVATFFALYPDPLGLADGTYYCVAHKSPKSPYTSKRVNVLYI
jgi:hypothetical protein